MAWARARFSTARKLLGFLSTKACRLAMSRATGTTSITGLAYRQSAGAENNARTQHPAARIKRATKLRMLGLERLAFEMNGATDAAKPIVGDHWREYPA